MRVLFIFLFLPVLIIGCTAPERTTEKTSPTQTTPIETPAHNTPNPLETPITKPSENVGDLGIDSIEKELREMEELISELESLENITFEI